MKRTVSILLLVLFLFNVGGYYFVFWGLRKQVSFELTQQLDKGIYREAETVELKMSIPIPYVGTSDEFSRIKGKFEYNGNFYHLIKQKLENDTLYVVCIPDMKEKNLVSTMTDYAQVTNELPDQSKKVFHFLSKLLKEFRTSTTTSSNITTGWTIGIEHCATIDSTLPAFTSIASPPPKLG